MRQLSLKVKQVVRASDGMPAVPASGGEGW